MVYSICWRIGGYPWGPRWAKPRTPWAGLVEAGHEAKLLGGDSD
eukprot:CAMPEP_0180784736 /NCGR_PEP_ID=MMETSP1038_2-20121128/49776_1 /TAXON_ID=632150 /ORGANISM="Azadinium spinosum, Strain 3D9" /LENGTH=43 /DNA_ID= /DNA_START= /DNA_END= /DNA_ORIENTATION=